MHIRLLDTPKASGRATKQPSSAKPLVIPPSVSAINATVVLQQTK